MDRSVEELGPEPPAWWRRGQPKQLTMATVADHFAVQEDIAGVAAETAGDEPAAAGDGAGDGAGDDEPAEPCAKRRKTHIRPEAKEWFCSFALVKRDWTMAQCLRFAKKALPPFFEHVHIDTTRKWIAQKTPGTALGRPRSLEPAAVLALAGIVSRVGSRVPWRRSVGMRHLASLTASLLSSPENSFGRVLSLSNGEGRVASRWSRTPVRAAPLLSAWRRLCWRLAQTSSMQAQIICQGKTRLRCAAHGHVKHLPYEQATTSRGVVMQPQRRPTHRVDSCRTDRMW